jgi:hypothetical protein
MSLLKVTEFVELPLGHAIQLPTPTERNRPAPNLNADADGYGQEARLIVRLPAIAENANAALP